MHPLPLLLATLLAATFLAAPLAAAPALPEDRPTALEPALELAAGEVVLTVVGTNDIHGQLTPTDRYRRPLGGMDWLAGHVGALRAHSARHYGGRGAVLLLDAGDAIQGTLLSNHSEGLAMVRVMNQIGYTAAIAGNHGFDFGPVGWTVDRVTPDAPDADPLGALRRAVQAADFPFLGANVRVREGGAHLGWLPPYTLAPLPGGRRVAVIGLESPHTPATTERANVAALRFEDPTATLAELVQDLDDRGLADVFVVAIHEGDGATLALRELLEAMPTRRDGRPLVDAVIAGHSHARNSWIAGGIPYVQSLASGAHLGMIQLVLRPDPHGRLRVARDRTRKQAAIPVVPRERHFMGEPVRAHAGVAAEIRGARAAIAALADRPLGVALGPLPRTGGRLADSVTGNLLADMMRAAARTQVAVINSGDIRDELPAGPLRYEQLFQVVPKNLQLVTLPAVPVPTLVKNLWRSIESCGRRGALQVSGLVVEFRRDCECPEVQENGVDPEARLLRLSTHDGRLLYEHREGGSYTAPEPVTVATSDFVHGGGAGYPAFRGLEAMPDPPPLRDRVAERMAARGHLDPADFAVGRYRQQGPSRCDPAPAP